LTFELLYSKYLWNATDDLYLGVPLLLSVTPILLPQAERNGLTKQGSGFQGSLCSVQSKKFF